MTRQYHLNHSKVSLGVGKRKREFRYRVVYTRRRGVVVKIMWSDASWTELCHGSDLEKFILEYHYRWWAEFDEVW